MVIYPCRIVLYRVLNHMHGSKIDLLRNQSSPRLDGIWTIGVVHLVLLVEVLLVAVALVLLVVLY